MLLACFYYALAACGVAAQKLPRHHLLNKLAAKQAIYLGDAWGVVRNEPRSHLLPLAKDAWGVVSKANLALTLQAQRSKMSQVERLNLT